MIKWSTDHWTSINEALIQMHLCCWAGAAQTRALHRGVLSAHCCQNGRGGEQSLTQPWTHPHQPKQIHRVRPQPHGENHLRETQRGSRRGDGPDLPAPLPLCRRLSVCWKVRALLFLLIVFFLWWLQFPWSRLNRFFFMRSVTSGSQWGSLYILREEVPSIGRLEAQLKACLCRLVFSKAKVRIALRWQFARIAIFALNLWNVFFCLFGLFYSHQCWRCPSSLRSLKTSSQPRCWWASSNSKSI